MAPELTSFPKCTIVLCPPALLQLDGAIWGILSNGKWAAVTCPCHSEAVRVDVPSQPLSALTLICWLANVKVSTRPCIEHSCASSWRKLGSLNDYGTEPADHIKMRQKQAITCISAVSRLLLLNNIDAQPHPGNLLPPRLRSLAALQRSGLFVLLFFGFWVSMNLSDRALYQNNY
jgi:hypothetical protein